MLSPEELEQLSWAAILKWVFFGTCLLCVPYSLLMSLLALFGWQTVSWGGKPITGILALIAGPFLGIFAAVVLTVAIGGGCLVARRVFQSLAEPDSAEPESAEEES